MKEKITIYTNETCPYCKQIKETLKENEINFIEKSIEEHAEEWSQLSELLVMAQLPTLSFNEEFYVPGRDYMNPDHLIQLIKNHKKSKYDYSIRTYERIKSLNANMAQVIQSLVVKINNIESYIINKKDSCKDDCNNGDESTS